MVFKYKTKIILFKIFIDLFAEISFLIFILKFIFKKKYKKRKICVCMRARARECVRVKKIWIIKQIVL